LAFDKSTLSILKEKVTPASGEILMFLKERYPTPFLKSTIISKIGLSQYVGVLAFERLESAALITCNKSSNGFSMYQLSEHGLSMLELIENNEI
jgi:predicted transcriptional regulator with HTH domain